MVPQGNGCYRVWVPEYITQRHRIRAGYDFGSVDAGICWIVKELEIATGLKEISIKEELPQ